MSKNLLGEIRERVASLEAIVKTSFSNNWIEHEKILKAVVALKTSVNEEIENHQKRIRALEETKAKISLLGGLGIVTLSAVGSAIATGMVYYLLSLI